MSEHFFIVGAQRSGTTYLYRVLDEHPEIEMAKPLKPEPKFFHIDSSYEKGLVFYQDHYFSNNESVRVYGEKSTTYLESKRATGRIAECYPHAKILVILRDPIERAISNYWFSVNNGWETLPIEEAFRREDDRRCNYDPEKISVSPYAYLKRGCYIDYLLMYESYFSAENIKVMLYEQFIGSETYIFELFTFLGVSKFIPPVLHTTVNKGNKPDTSLSLELERYLVNYFAEPNARLAEHLNISLQEWQR
jgi:hypothetical protein